MKVYFAKRKYKKVTATKILWLKNIKNVSM